MARSFLSAPALVAAAGCALIAPPPATAEQQVIDNSPDRPAECRLQNASMGWNTTVTAAGAGADMRAFWRAAAAAPSDLVVVAGRTREATAPGALALFMGRRNLLDVTLPTTEAHESFSAGQNLAPSGPPLTLRIHVAGRSWGAVENVRGLRHRLRMPDDLVARLRDSKEIAVGLELDGDHYVRTSMRQVSTIFAINAGRATGHVRTLRENGVDCTPR